MDCSVCGSGPAVFKLRKNEIDILECPSCGLAFWARDESSAAEELYDAHYFDDPLSRHGYDDYASLAPSLRLNFARRLARIPRRNHEARLLDIGAAYGFGVAEARELGWKAWGLEVSRAAARQAIDLVPGALVTATARHLPFADSSFDAVTLWDVLEHLADPHACIGEVHRVLRPGGRLALSTGDVGSWVARLSRSRWHLYTLPEHLYFFTRRSLALLLEGHGFVVTGIRAEGSLYTLSYLIERLRKSLLQGSPSRRAHWPGAAIRVPVNLFDVVTVHAHRP